jgi:hypothetical protein
MELLRHADVAPDALTCPRTHIETGDALTLGLRAGTFDVVLVNPPYMSAIEMKRSLAPDVLQRYKASYRTARGAADLYVLFFELSLRLLRQGGSLALICPNKFLSAPYGEALRAYLREHARLETLLDYSNHRVFRAASVYPVVVCLQKGAQGEHPLRVGRPQATGLPGEYRSFSPERLDRLPSRIWGFLLNDKLCLVERILERAEPLTCAGRVLATSTAGEAEKYHELIDDSGAGYRLVNTGTIDPWVNLWGRRPLVDKGKKYLEPRLPRDAALLGSTRHELYRRPKIVLSKTALRAEAFFDERGEYASINTNCIHSFREGYAPKYILAWIHSRLFHFTYTCFFDSVRMSGGYLAFSAPMLRAMCIPRAPAERLEVVVGLVDAILAIKRTDPGADTRHLEARVDEVFFELVGLSDGERRVVSAAALV